MKNQYVPGMGPCSAPIDTFNERESIISLYMLDHMDPDIRVNENLDTAAMVRDYNEKHPDTPITDEDLSA